MTTKPVNRNDAIERTGQLMLSGWKLLATPCPICHTALLSKSDAIRCPGCDLPVMKEGANQTVSDAVPAVVQVAEPSNVVVQEPSSFEEMKKEYDRRNQRSNQISAKLGEKMLQGWTMLAESCIDFDTCGGTPLMKDPKAGAVVCLSCNKEYQYTDAGELVLKKADALIADTKPSFAAVAPTKQTTMDYSIHEFDHEEAEENEPPRLAKFQQNTNDSSWKISQKLLMGWTLLDASCDRCSGRVPLMKNLQGKVRKYF